MKYKEYFINSLKEYVLPNYILKDQRTRKITMANIIKKLNKIGLFIQSMKVC